MPEPAKADIQGEVPTSDPDRDALALDPDRAEIKVSRQDLDLLLEALENPPEPSPALERLAQQYNNILG